MPLVSALVSPHDFAIVGFDVAGLALQGLNARFFIHPDDQGFFGWIEIQAHYVCRFGGKLLVRADTPGTLPLQADSFLTQNAPHRMHRTVERGGHRRTVPAGLAGRRGLFQQGQHPVAKVRAINRLGPGRGASRSPAKPLWTKRCRHLMTVLGRVRQSEPLP